MCEQAGLVPQEAHRGEEENDDTVDVGHQGPYRSKEGVGGLEEGENEVGEGDEQDTGEGDTGQGVRQAQR